MLDHALRQIKESLLSGIKHTPLGAADPLLLTLTGFGTGLLAGVAVWQHAYGWGLGLWILNRVLDGLDGSAARWQGRQSDLGGYVDMCCDVVIYALIPFTLTLSQDAHWSSLAILLASFYINLCSWAYLAAILEKRQQGSPQLTTIRMPTGLIEGTETIIFYSLFLLLPQYQVWLFGVMAILVLLTAAQRLVWACQHLSGAIPSAGDK